MAFVIYYVLCIWHGQIAQAFIKCFDVVLIFLGLAY